MTDDRVDLLLMDCLAQPATEWGGRVERLCADHPAFAGELRRRFRKLVDLGIFEEEADPDSAAPQRLGHFLLLRQVGAGGMGVVHEAHDEKLDRRVALKILRGEHLFFDGLRQRFGREVLAASRLDHPNICPVYEANEIDGVPYLAMRFIDGPTLAQVLAERRRDHRQRGASTRGASEASRLEFVLLIEKLARALHEAHEAGIAHRDVKPQNVLIDPSGEPVLVDFGLARETDSDGTLTRTGDRVGTPAYMAPEQISGRGAIDRRTDVYALGVTLYECLTLRCPHESAVREDLYRQILTEPAPDPRTADRRLPAEISVVVGKALEKNPGDRFATALEFAEELRRIRQHEPIESRRQRPWLRAVRWCQRNRTASSVMAATAAGLVVALFLLRQSLVAEANAEQRTTELRAQSLLGKARQVVGRDPVLAFQYAREAFRQHDSPEIVGGLQEVMFRLRKTSVIADDEAAWRLEVSPGGRFLAVARLNKAPRLFRRRENGHGYSELTLPDVEFQSSPRLVASQQVWFSPDGDELAVHDGYLGNPVTRPVQRFDLSGEQPRALAPVPVTERSPERRGESTGALHAVHVRYPADPADRRFLVVCGGEAVLWTREDDPRRLATLVLDHSALWLDGAFLHDGRILACGAIWSADGERRVRVLERPGPNCLGVHHVLVDEDSFTLVGGRRQVRRFDLDGEPVARRLWTGTEAPRAFIAAHVDRSTHRLLLVDSAGCHRALDYESLRLLNNWVSPTAEVSSTSQSPDGSRMLCAGGRVLYIYDRDGRLLDELPGPRNAAWSTNDEVVSEGDGTIKAWHPEALAGVPAVVALDSHTLDVSPSGHHVAVTFEREQAVRVYDTRAELVAEHRVVAAVDRVMTRFAGDREIVIAQHAQSTFALWDFANSERTQPRAIAGPTELVNAPTRLADGRWFMVRHGSTHKARAWREGDAERSRALTAERQSGCVASSRDGRLVVCAGLSPVRVLEFDGSTVGKERFKSNEMLLVRSLAMSADGGSVLAGTGDNNAYLWDWQESDTARVLGGHQAPVQGVGFSLDGRFVATGALDDTILVRDRATLRPVIELHHEGFSALGFTADGRLVSSGRDGAVRWWALDAETLARTLDGIDIPELTPEQRARVANLLRR